MQFPFFRDFGIYVKEMIHAFPDSATTLLSVFLGYYLSEIFHPLFDDNLHLYLHIHTNVDDLDQISRSERHRKDKTERTVGFLANSYPIEFKEYVLINFCCLCKGNNWHISCLVCLLRLRSYPATTSKSILQTFTLL